LVFAFFAMMFLPIDPTIGFGQDRLMKNQRLGTREKQQDPMAPKKARLFYLQPDRSKVRLRTDGISQRA
jgi:hypothetical protein